MSKLSHLSRTEKHIHAKGWVIQAPDGQIYECRNLTNWFREHADWIDGTPKRARDAFSDMKRAQLNKSKNRLYQWKGWRLLSWDD